MPSGSVVLLPEPTPRTRRKPVRTEQYPQLLRNATRAWWKPLVSLLVLVAGFFGVQIALMIAVMISGALAGVHDVPGWTNRLFSSPSDPLGFALTNISLASLIPVTMLALWAGHQVRPSVTWSVRGRLRWGWTGLLAAALFPLWALYLGIMWALSGFETGARPQHWVALVVLCLLTTPLQCAGEEFGFRVWFLQSIGSFFRHSWLAVLVPMALSVPLFALAHGSLDAWILADLGLFALAAGIVSWRTGGIEAAVVMHSANNVLLMLQTILFGGFDQAFVSAETRGSWLTLIPTAIQLAIAVGMVWILARWRQVDRLGEPERFRVGARREAEIAAASEQAYAAWAARAAGQPAGTVSGGFPPGGPSA